MNIFRHTPKCFSKRLLGWEKGDWLPSRYFGQPAAQTHPHLIDQGEVTPGLTKDEYYNRRTQLMQRIASSRKTSPDHRHLVVIPAAPKTYMSNDIPYPFRQNTDFLYLCGFQEPDSVLILEAHTKDLPHHKSTLFVPKKDPHREMWDGPRSGIQGAIELTGVDDAYNWDDFGAYLDSHLNSYRSTYVWYSHSTPIHMDLHLKHMTDFIREVKFSSVENPRPLIQSLRLIKSPSEVKLMQKTCDIASSAFIETMKYSWPGINEAHLYAKMDFECRVNGAEMLAYPPVVAGGNRANTIHYISNNQLVNAGEMVLMDAGCECHGYTSDITRTWPVSGKFTPEQYALYEAVLEVQEGCIEVCNEEGITLEHVFLHMLQLLGKQLVRLGILSRQPTDSQQLIQVARKFCPHHVGHYLGMDVHDTDGISRHSPLLPGTVITIEPGIYIPNDMDGVSKGFLGQGIRIEDDILITQDKAHVLTSKCPKHPADIENILGMK